MRIKKESEENIMKIAEVSREVKLTPDTLRYYEKMGILGPVEKNRSGIREYQESDLKRIHFIKCMKASGLSIDAIREYIHLHEVGDTTLEERRDILLGQKDALLDQMNQLQETLNYLNNKITKYDNNINKKYNN